MSMIVIFVPYMNKSLFRKRPAITFSIFLEMFLMVFLAFSSHQFSKFHGLEKAETEDVINELMKLIQKLDVITFIFTFLMSKVIMGQSNNSHIIFAMISLLTMAGFLVLA